jgi:hypothetical protein
MVRSALFVRTWPAHAGDARVTSVASSSVALWILAAVFGTIAVPFVLIARRVFALDRVIATWPRAPGEVTSSHVDVSTRTRRDEEGYDHRYQAYEPIVRYTYTVAGRTYPGTNIGRVAYTTDKSSAQAILDRYPPGRRVEVIHDPSDPATAYLETKRSTGAVILFVFGCFFFALSALMILLALLVG